MVGSSTTGLLGGYANLIDTLESSIPSSTVITSDILSVKIKKKTYGELRSFVSMSPNKKKQKRRRGHKAGKTYLKAQIETD